MTRDEVTDLIQDFFSKFVPDAKPRSVVDYCKLPPVYFPPSFKAPMYRKYNGTDDPNHHINGFMLDSHLYRQDKAMLVHLFHKSLEGEALSWFTSLSATDLTSFDTVAEKFIS